MQALKAWQYGQMEVNMRRKKRMSGEKIFSIVISCAIVLTLILGVVSVVRNGNNNSSKLDNVVDLNETKSGNVALKTEDVTEAPTIKKVAETEAVTIGVGSTEKEVTVEDKTKEDVAVVSPTGASAKYTFGENDTLQWPVKGELVLKYSMDSTIYFKTLSVYKCNPSISIASQVGTNVSVAASGIVESVTISEETGTTVIVAIGNEYETTYGLIDGITVKKGDTVVAGQYLGKVAEPTKYYTQEGSNLYFKMTKGGAPVDPTLFLN